MSLYPPESSVIRELLAKATTELEGLLEAGSSDASEKVLAANPRLVEDPEAVLELLYTEHLFRREKGEEIGLADWQRRFPQWREDLRQLLQVHAVVQNATDDLSVGIAIEGSDSSVDGVVHATVSAGEGLRDYEFFEILGRGGMGVVHRARQRSLDRIVAVKVVANPGTASPSVLERFRAEAEAVAHLQHPNIVHIHEVGTSDGTPYFSMEFVPGGNLEEVTRRQSLAPVVAAQLLESVARAVQFAHERGVIHRDLKPANILLAPSQRGGAVELPAREEPDSVAPVHGTRQVEPKLTDFGLAKRIDLNSQRTLPGTLIGTPSFMAPEQVDGHGEEVGPACDVYSLGAILYDSLVGRPPFRAPTVHETLYQVRHDEPVPPRQLQSDVPQDLETICLKCLHKEATRRYRSAGELADDLRRFLEDRPILARPTPFHERFRKWTKRHPALAALWLAVILGVTGIAWQGWRAERSRIAAEREAQRAGLAESGMRAEKEHLRRLLYARDVSLAQHELSTDNTAHAEQLLAACPKELRNWEWHFLDTLCHETLWDFPKLSIGAYSVATSPDGNFVAAAAGAWGSNDVGEIQVRDLRSGALIHTLRGHPSSIMDVCYSPDGSRIASAGIYWHENRPGGVRIWDATTGQQVASLVNGGFSLAYSPDGEWLAIATESATIECYATNDFESAVDGTQMPQPAKILTGHRQPALDLAFRPDGRHLASAGRDGTLNVWNVETEELFKSVTGFGDCREVTYSPNNLELAVGMWSGAIKVFRQSADDLHEIASFARKYPINALRFSPDGMHLLIAQQTANTALCEARGGREIRTFPGHNRDTLDAAFTANGTRLVTGGADGAVRVWDLTAPRQPRMLRYFGGPHVAAAAMSPDGRRMILASTLNTSRGLGRNEFTARIVDLATAQVTKTIPAHQDWLTCIAFDPSGQTCLTGSLDGTAARWDLDALTRLATYSGHTDAVTGVAFLDQGNRVVTSSHDGTVRIWDAQDIHPSRSITVAGQPLVRLVADDDSKSIVVATTEGNVYLGNPHPGMPWDRIDDSWGKVICLAISPDGNLLAAGTEEGSIAIMGLIEFRKWAQGNRQRPCPAATAMRGHAEKVVNVEFSPDSQRLVSVSPDGTVRFWDPWTGHELLSLETPRSSSYSVRMGPDGRNLYLINAAQLWSWQTGANPRKGSPDDTRYWEAEWRRESNRAAVRNMDWFASAMHLSRLLQFEPNQDQYLKERARAYCRLRRWDLALADFETLEALGKSSSIPYEQALLRLHRGDVEAYREICRAAAANSSGDLRGTDANAIAWTCCLAPDSGVPGDEIVRIARLAVSQLKSRKATNTLGGALYRAGQIDEAIAVLAESVSLDPGGGVPEDWMLLALAHADLGHTSESEQWYQQTVTWIAEQETLWERGQPVDPRYGWQTSLELDLMVAEMKGRIPSGDPTPARN